MARLSKEYVQHLSQGPFPGRIDPWAEDACYFHQIHSGMIYELQAQMQGELNERGYLLGKEASLQVLGGRKPDIYIEGGGLKEEPPTSPTYDALATAVAVEPGTAVMDKNDLELDALHIISLDVGELVTVVEIISPRNKTHPKDMRRYREERDSLFLEQGVNVVEIDATRSLRRLIHDPLLIHYSAYHTAIHLPDEGARAVTSTFEEPLKPFALPLRDEVIRVEPHTAYERAYRSGPVAGLINKERRYAADALPYPSMLTDAQREAALAAVKAWQGELARLDQPTP